jgi:hypothetical protein
MIVPLLQQMMMVQYHQLTQIMAIKMPMMTMMAAEEMGMTVEALAIQVTVEMAVTMEEIQQNLRETVAKTMNIDINWYAQARPTRQELASQC